MTRRGSFFSLDLDSTRMDVVGDGGRRALFYPPAQNAFAQRPGGSKSG